MKMPELMSGASGSCDEERGNEHKMHRLEGYGIGNQEGVAPLGAGVKPNKGRMWDPWALWGPMYMMCELNITRD